MRLGNTRAVCRKCYIHPAVLDAYLDGSLLDALQKRARVRFAKRRSLKPEEAAVLAFLATARRRRARPAAAA